MSIDDLSQWHTDLRVASISHGWAANAHDRNQPAMDYWLEYQKGFTRHPTPLEFHPELGAYADRIRTIIDLRECLQ